MNTDFIKGIIPPILTPVDADERIDEPKLRDQLEFMIQGGIHGVLASGSNSEFYMQDEAESLRGLKILLDQAKGRIPVYMGIGSIRTKTCVDIAKAAVKAGAPAISVLHPMFLKPNDTELYQHFKAIADAVPGTPMLMYNNPGRTGYGMSAELIMRLAHDVKNIVGIKESSGDMTLAAELIRLSRGTAFRVLGGKDTLIFGTMVHGGAGAVATTANFAPELVCSIYEKYMAGDIHGSLEAQFRLNPVRLSMDKASFPVGTKDLANLLGRNIGLPYLPNLPSAAPVIDLMKTRLKEAGLL